MENELCVADANEPVKVTVVNSTECATNGDAFLPVETSGHAQAIKSRDTTGDLPSELYVYRQDVVRCNKRKDLIGVVTEVAGDSDSDSGTSDDEDDEDEDDDGGGGGGDGDVENGSGNNDNEGGAIQNDSLVESQVRVIWLDHSETANNLSDITVVDRGFLHGDMVAALSDPTGQLGVVVDVHMTVDLVAADGAVIKNVSSRNLQRVRDFTVGDYVVHGPWLGRVDDVLDNVTVLFDDGSMCKVMKVEPSRLKPVSKSILEDAHFPYHPGQRVKASSLSVFKNARWLSGVWKANRLEGTVMKVQAGSVFVYWIASANPGYGSESAGVPYEEQAPKDLTLLSCFAHANWQLGDWCLLPSAAKFSSVSLPGAFSNEKSDDLCKGSESHSASDEPDLASPDNHAANLLCSEETIEDNEDITANQNPISQDPRLASDPPTRSFGSMYSDKISKLDENSGKVENNASTECESCSSSLSVSNKPVHESWPVHRKKIHKVVVRRDRKARRRDETFERALHIINTMTKVDVVWQDGSREFGRDSKTLIPVNSPGDHEFCPEQYVVEKAPDVGDVASEVRHVGVVKSVNAKERTASVRWLKSVARPEDPREFDNEEMVSVYELEDHPDYDYCYGDVVVRLSPVSVAANGPIFRCPAEEQEQQAGPSQANADKRSRKHLGPKKSAQASKDQTDLNFSGLSWVGNITGLQDGDIEVTWADGMVSKVGPQAIYVVGRDDDEESIEHGSEVSDAASWETVDENEMDTLENMDLDLGNASGNNSEMAERTSANTEENNSGRNGPLSIPLAALGFVTRLATGLFSRGRRQIDTLDSDCNGAHKSELETVETYMEAAAGSQGSPSLDEYSAKTSEETAKEYGLATLPTDSEVKNTEIVDTVLSEEPKVSSMQLYYQDHPCSFKCFDIAKDPGDHYYLSANGQISGRKWIKKVQQEWSILEKNLPDGIYVRVYEDRMDLLRGVIVGAYGTPYQDGLFFFDFYLPPEYPEVPPSAYYHSGGLRLNPNLYEDGKVCLSLLNTWTGKGNEVWDPSSSSILQVLVSLQGLVLNSKPYFNEAGYDKQVGTLEGEKNSLSYNESTFLLNCKSIMYLLRRPPKHFEELVKHHFQRRGHYILKACDAYMKGCLVGSLTEDACRSDKSGKDSNSVGFKLMLGKIFPKLVLALREVGADCPDFLHPQQL